MTRAKALTVALREAQDNAAGADDPFAGVISWRALLYAVGPRRKHGWDGYGGADHVHVRRDGYSSAHVGPCSIEPREDPANRLIRQAGLDRDEAELLRLLYAEPDRGYDVHATVLRVSLRTVQRRVSSIRAKLEAMHVTLERIREEP